MFALLICYFWIMEEQGYIEIRVDGVDRSLSPDKIDINDIREMVTDIELFLYPSREERRLRPAVSYNLEPGSVIHKFL